MARIVKAGAVAAVALRLLRTEQGRRFSAGAVNQAASAVDGLTKQRHSARIEQVRAMAERQLRGQSGATGAGDAPPGR